MYFTKEKLKTLHTNQRLLIEELIKNEVNVSPIDLSIELVEAEYKWHKEYILDRFCSNIPYVQAQITSDKILTKNILVRNSINTPKGAIFDVNQVNNVNDYVEKYLNFPLVIKPNWGSHWDNIYTDIENIEELEDTIKDFLLMTEWKMPFIIEEQFIWEEYRIFVAKNWDYAALHRERPFIIWDWKNTIWDLAKEESKKRVNNKLTKLCPIIIDERFLLKQKLWINYIPKLNEKVYVRNLSNIAKWWFSHNVTDIVHPTIIWLANNTLNAFIWLPYIWVDFMYSKDISKELSLKSYSVIEVNTNPWISMHMLPWDNKPVNIAKTLVKLMFPELK